ncbi:MAG: hypothetical protein EBY20_06325, partial [Alphaproteobacteria bacterium]|nr:hypothetical protein [Alphaproteobacteria bacterium]
QRAPVAKTLSVTEEHFLDSIKTGRSQHEIFNGIAASILASCPDQIDEKESRKLARNLIGFCQKIIDLQIKQDLLD